MERSAAMNSCSVSAPTMHSPHQAERHQKRLVAHGIDVEELYAQALLERLLQHQTAEVWVAAAAAAEYRSATCQVFDIFGGDFLTWTHRAARSITRSPTALTRTRTAAPRRYSSGSSSTSVIEIESG